ncbi:hypothetical protein BN2476_300089 [Paraburkholderia piptadeniae]|uniref:Uncharacterized protein n=1 Tax=Paraburkholderia piptadeniae TaxID=1701573 RepID=A0A1N7S2J3_9BURK|nr:hypothetical protein [Paraburkholderia piptadeniae]SIT41613.1 hypothetical protein BN2476_300089 [Paraburkholderia piptadeniae]
MASEVKWDKDAKASNRESLAGGRFMWVSVENEDNVIVVFSTDKGLDFNLTYSIKSGTLMKVSGAR